MKYVFSTILKDEDEWSEERTVENIEQLLINLRSILGHNISRDEIRNVILYHESLSDVKSPYCDYLKIYRQTFMVKAQPTAKKIMVKLMENYPTEREWTEFRELWQTMKDL